MTPRLSPAAAALAAALLLAPHAAAQRDTVAVVGPAYRAGGLKSFLLGTDYRDLWTTPVRFPVLDLATFGGGLTPTEKGGGNQTVSLRFRGGDGREYAFRLADKDQVRGAHPDVRGTLAGEILQDQVSSLLPWAAVVADPLAEAAGVLRIPAAAYVMPDDPRLGEFRAEFAGKPGFMEERPSTGATGIAELAAADAVVETEDFLEALEGDASQRLDAREYLAGRLLDVMFADWDRHEDQYRWARYGRVWRPVPRDRDYAFVDYDGFLIDLVRGSVPNALRFRPGYGGQLRGLTQSAQFLDRRFLTELPRQTWDSVAAAVQARLTDAVIDDAFRRLPPEHQPLAAAELAGILKRRRDLLRDVALDLYRLYIREAEVHARGVDDAAEVQRLPDGGVEVRVTARGAGEPYFVRRFTPDETAEVRVFLKGGNDAARVYGAGLENVVVRVVGGEGDDEFRDETRSGARTAFYDHQGENRFAPRPGTKVDRRRWEEPKFERGGGRSPPRDWGVSSSWLAPTARWEGEAGPVVGAGPVYKRRGFRRSPHASARELRLLYAPLTNRWGVEGSVDRRYVGSRDRFELLLRASGLEATRFHGFGNQTPDFDADTRRVWERQLLAEPTFTWARGSGTELWVGGTLRLTDPEVRAGSPADVFGGLGTERFTLAGARAGLRFDRAGEASFPRSGWTADLSAGAFTPIDGDAGTFARTRGAATAYLPLGRGPVVALRAGGEKVWGDFPLQYAAFLGGGRSVRGYSSQRFAGDAAAWGGAELRQVLTRAEIVVRGDLGVLALADAGRVWYGGNSDGGWHTAYGGGVFFSFLDHAYTASATWAYGEKGKLYLALGMPF